MTFLLTEFAAIITTTIWYKQKGKSNLNLGLLCWMFWGATIMWLVDAIFEFASLHADFFKPSAADMLNDTFLGLSVIALALLVWIIVLLIKDPAGVVRSTLNKNSASKK